MCEHRWAAREDFEEARRAFVSHAVDLLEAWQKLEDPWSAGYPGYLPSFDEFVHDLIAWRDGEPHLPRVGSRMILVRDVDRFPHFTVLAGSMGTVVEASPTIIRVCMDRHVEGADHWDNELWWHPGPGSDPRFDQDAQVLRIEVPQWDLSAYLFAARTSES